jgi:hypothetical protein
MLEKTPKAPKPPKTKTVPATAAAGATPPDRAPRPVVIQPPKFETANILIRGTAPLVMNNFSQKAREAIIAKQLAGSQARKDRKREAKDFEAAYEGARHLSDDGWDGIPASAFRNGMISACRVASFTMTLAKLSLFVEPDGFDRANSMPLVKITKGKPSPHTMHARPELGGMDIRVRPMWREGWEANLRLRWDADQFSASDVVNLLMRVGQQVGIGEGRPDSKRSAGLGWGLFEVVQ